MDFEKIFNDLESNQTHECEEAKRKLGEFFTQKNKEQYLVHNMMDYYLKTGSLRIMEVLVKVQSPHDSYIFDRLADWLKMQSHRVQALNLFCFVVRKHPTWLFKVEKHRLIKDIIKLLLNEKEIVPLMSALLCIITLLPIIPNLVPNFLNELFDVFGHLASWNSQNPKPLPGDKLLHLQLGLQMLFHRLYGMYPCNFLAYLSEFTRKEKGAIFHHTIKPLLETVRVHPMLVTATQESEVSNARWKEMEPHDVVVECANLSLPVVYQDLNAEQTYQQLNSSSSSDLMDTSGAVVAVAAGALTRSATAAIANTAGSGSGFGMMRTMRANTTTGATSQHHYAAANAAAAAAYRGRAGSGHVTRFDVSNNSGSAHGCGVIWSPFNEISASGPIPLTPTPSYVLPVTSTSAAVAADNLSQQLLGLPGSSPPEAAVEATPETTPMKDVTIMKHHSLGGVGGGGGGAPSAIMSNPRAVRAIFHVAGSQPGSPMQKDVDVVDVVNATASAAAHNQFNFPDMMAQQPSDGTATRTTTVLEHEVSTTRLTRVTTTLERKLQQMRQDRNHSQSPFQTIDSLAAKQQQQQQQNVDGAGFRSPMDTTNCPNTPDIDVVTGQHAVTPTQPTSTTTINSSSSTSDHIKVFCLECNETDHSMCTAGGLYIPTSRSMQLLAKGIKRRNRMASYCYNDSSCEKISARGPKDIDADVVEAVEAVKVRRTKSCSSICVARPQSTTTTTTSDDGTDDDLAVVNLGVSQRRLQKSGKMMAIASAAVTGSNNKADAADVAPIPLPITTSHVAHVSSQTVELLPQNYENSLFALLVENNEMRNSYERNQLYPHEILDQYILRTIRSKESFEVDHRLDKDQLKEQLQLLRLQLHYERYRREIHAERNRRLMGRSRDKRSLEMERDRLNEQLKSFAAETKNLELVLDRTMKGANQREQTHTNELAALKAKYQNEVEQNKCLREANEKLQTRLSEELTQRKDLNYELEALRGQIFNMTSELQHAQVQAEMGAQCKQELARLEAEFIIMGEVQVKCRDRLAEVDNFRARDEELQMLQESYNRELNDLKPMLAEKASHLDSAKYKILELQAQLLNNEKVIAEQKRLLKTVKDEYEERFKSVNKKYELQKIIIAQMEEKIMMSVTKPQAAILLNACSPDTDRTDVASSMDRNSPLSTSLASSESLSASLRSTELRNLQQLVESPEVAGASIIEGTRLPALDLASSANSAATATAAAAAASASGGGGGGMIGSSLPASAINIVPPVSSSGGGSSSGVSGAVHNFDVVAGAATGSQHAHPHLHLQQKR